MGDGAAQVFGPKYDRRPRMTWKQGDRYYIVSDKGYCVCKVIVMDKTSYEAWALGPSLKRAWIGSFADSAAAKRACEEHAK